MSTTNFLEKLRQFDAYPKPTEDAYRLKTFEGAAGWFTGCFNLKYKKQFTKYLFFASVTIISACVIAILIAVEFNDYLLVKLNEELFVDTSRNPNMSINLNIVFSTISCDCKHNKNSFKKYFVLFIMLCFSPSIRCNGLFRRTTLNASTSNF